jgi:hypothetical protein
MRHSRRRATIPDHSQCLWCDKNNVLLDEDHVFPRAIGGTKELWVPACRDCQTVISKLELEAARQSNYSLFTVTHGPPGRDKRRPASGVIRARYLLVKNPLGGYGESAMYAGSETPVSLPHIEIDVAGSSLARRRGPNPPSVQRLVDALKNIVHRKPDARGFIGELEIRTDRLPEIDSDPDFWPRVVLDLSGHVYLRARNHDEALKFVAILVQALNAGVFDHDYSAWSTSEIIGGSPHWLALSYDRFVGQRLAGKIACGLMFLQFGSTVRSDQQFQVVRKFTLGNTGELGKLPVTQLCDAGTQTQWNGEHVAFICGYDGRVFGVVSIYGDCQMVEFGTGSETMVPDENQVAMCKWDGTQARFVPATSVPQVVTELRSRVASFCASPGASPLV